MAYGAKISVGLASAALLVTLSATWHRGPTTPAAATGMNTIQLAAATVSNAEMAPPQETGESALESALESAAAAQVSAPQQTPAVQTPVAPALTQPLAGTAAENPQLMPQLASQQSPEQQVASQLAPEACNDLSGKFVNSRDKSVWTFSQSGCAGDAVGTTWKYAVSGTSVAMDGTELTGSIRGKQGNYTISWSDGVTFTQQEAEAAEAVPQQSSASSAAVGEAAGAVAAAQQAAAAVALATPAPLAVATAPPPAVAVAAPLAVATAAPEAGAAAATAQQVPAPVAGATPQQAQASAAATTTPSSFGEWVADQNVEQPPAVAPTLAPEGPAPGQVETLPQNSKFAAQAPTESKNDGNQCSDDEEFHAGLCYHACSAMTDNVYTFRQSAWTCCKKKVCNPLWGSCCKRSFGMCSGFDVAGKEYGENVCPHQIGACLKNEELTGGMCYKKCAVLTNGNYPYRTAAATCCKQNGGLGCMMGGSADKSAMSKYQNSITDNSFKVGGYCDDKEGQELCEPHVPQTALTEN